MRNSVLVGGILATTLISDQVTKEIAVRYLKGEPPIGVSGARFVYAENPGAFLGLGANLPDTARTALFVVLAGVLVAGAAYMLYRKRAELDRLALVTGALFVGGALGNLIDRVLRDGGRVVDFMQMGWRPLQTGVFNIADIALMVALGLVLFGPFVFRKKKKKGKPAADVVEA